MSMVPEFSLPTVTYGMKISSPGVGSPASDVTAAIPPVAMIKLHGNRAAQHVGTGGARFQSVRRKAGQTTASASLVPCVLVLPGPQDQRGDHACQSQGRGE